MSKLWIIPTEEEPVTLDVPDVRLEWLVDMLGGYVGTAVTPDGDVLWFRDDAEEAGLPINVAATLLAPGNGTIHGSAILTGKEHSDGFEDAPDLPTLDPRTAVR